MPKTVTIALAAAIIAACLAAPADARKPSKDDARESTSSAVEDADFSTVLEAALEEEVVDNAPEEEAVWTATVQGELLDCGDGVDCGEGVPASWWRTGRWSVLSELTLLQPSFASTNYGTGDNRGFVGPRLSLSWEAPNGFGIRGRAWGFDNEANLDRDPQNPDVTVLVDSMTFSANKFDLDFYRSIEHGTGSFLFGAGLSTAHMTTTERHAYSVQSDWYSYYSPLYGLNAIIDDSYYNPYGYGYYYYPFGQSRLISQQWNETGYQAFYEGSQQIRVAGVGPQLLIEGTHRFYEGSFTTWSVFGRGRAAWMIGQARLSDSTYTPVRTKSDANMAVTEAQFGAECRRQFARCDMTLQCSFEVQSWDMSFIDRVNLAGVTTGVGVDW